MTKKPTSILKRLRTDKQTNNKQYDYPLIRTTCNTQKTKSKKNNGT